MGLFSSKGGIITQSDKATNTKEAKALAKGGKLTAKEAREAAKKNS